MKNIFYILIIFSVFSSFVVSEVVVEGVPLVFNKPVISITETERRLIVHAGHEKALQHEIRSDGRNIQLVFIDDQIVATATSTHNEEKDYYSHCVTVSSNRYQSQIVSHDSVIYLIIKCKKDQSIKRILLLDSSTKNVNVIS